MQGFEQYYSPQEFRGSPPNIISLFKLSSNYSLQKGAMSILSYKTKLHIYIKISNLYYSKLNQIYNPRILSRTQIRISNLKRKWIIQINSKLKTEVEKEATQQFSKKGLNFFRLIYWNSLVNNEGNIHN